ncbi:SMI1/KNR4 family protein [Formosa sp. PL04]|uniref:SMI1/KNR4 family protein n=1 Tax=Formosa sp. PL04 TaxID=3081755 RepID=UPI002981CD38|nr:SMI1/KNR4 family protein [Formosa sp. PL04]MDW5289617.1 hypothetical protein [Formosa sp. PL04]
MIKKEYLKTFSNNSGITTNKLESLKFPKNLPQDYLEFLIIFNGGEGFVGENYLVLTKAESLLQLNMDSGIDTFDNQIFLIGGNGASEAIAIDFRNDNPKYILLPLIFEYDAILELGATIEDLFAHIFEKGFFKEE